MAFEIRNADDLIRVAYIDRDNLERELRNQPGRYAWIGARLVRAAAKVMFFEDQLEELKARLGEKLSENGLNINQVRYRIGADSRVLEAKRNLRHWKQLENFYRQADKIFTQRAAMLQTLSANTRKEKQSYDDVS